MTQILHLDGSQGQGGGRIRRTALSLALLTGQPFQLDAIRTRIYGDDGKGSLGVAWSLKS